MKMGTIASPWRYDDIAKNTLEAALVRRACPLHYPSADATSAIACVERNVYYIARIYTLRWIAMRTNIEIDDTLMAEAQEASGHATKKQTVEEALRLMIKLRRQHEADAAFGKYRWRGNLAQSRKGRGTG